MQRENFFGKHDYLHVTAKNVWTVVALVVELGVKVDAALRNDPESVLVCARGAVVWTENGSTT